MTIQTAVLIETLVDLGAEVNGVHVIFFLLKIMPLLRLHPQGYPYLLGKE